MNSKVHNYYNLGLQLLIGLIAYTFLIKQLFFKNDLEQIILSFRALLNPGKVIPGILLVVFLMFINWGIEAIKWKKLIDVVEIISFKDAIIAVFTGITVSFFTPNRVGEFLGRAFMLKNINWVQSSVLTIVGSITQFIVTVVIGSLALILFLHHFTSLFISLNLVYTIGILIGWVCLTVLLVFALFQVRALGFMGTNREFTGWRKKIIENIDVLRKIPAAILAKVLLFSILRYLVFSIQTILLLKFLGVNISVYDAFIINALVFLILTAIPTIAIAELGVRGSVAIFLYGFYERNLNGYMSGTIDMQVILVFSLLWIINIALPAVLGSFGLGKLRFFRNSNL